MTQRSTSEVEAGSSAAAEIESRGPEWQGSGAGGIRVPEDVSRALSAWRESLVSVKRSIDEAVQAVGALRATLLDMAPLWSSLGELERALKDIRWEDAPVAATKLEAAAPAPAAVEEAAVSTEAPSLEAGLALDAKSPPAGEPSAPKPEVPAQAAETAVGAFSEPHRPLPAEGIEREPPAAHSYTVTVEDPGSETPLVPLYRALGRVGRIRDMELVSYTNGVAVISLQSDEEIAGDDLRQAISEAMERACRVVNLENNAFVVRLEAA